MNSQEDQAPRHRTDGVTNAAAAPLSTADLAGGGALPRIRARWIGLLFLVALGLRLGYLFELRSNPLLAVAFGDDAFFWQWGSEIARGEQRKGIYYHAPLYPHFIALVQWCFGESLLALRLVQAVLGSLACVFLAKAGERFFSPSVGLAAGYVLACYAPVIFFEALTKKVGLGLFLMSALLMLVARAQERPRLSTYAAAGLVLGLLSISRENARVLLPIILTPLLLARSGAPLRTRASYALVLTASFAVVLGAVGLRNHFVGGEWVFGTTNLGTNAFIGNHAGATGLCEAD